MLFQKEKSEAKVQIKKYSPGKITTSIGIFDKSLLIVEGEQVPFSEAVCFSELTDEHLTGFKDNPPEILIIGSGANHQILPFSLTASLNSLGIAVESMASREACHTYQVLSYEQRKVSALIFA